MFIIGGSLGLLTGMRLITGLEILFWLLAMITRLCFKFEGKEKISQKVGPKANAKKKDFKNCKNSDLAAAEKVSKSAEDGVSTRTKVLEEKSCNRRKFNSIGRNGKSLSFSNKF